MEHVTIKNIKDPICQYADFNVEICLNGSASSVLIYGQSGRRATAEAGLFSLRFEVGGVAVYHSFNLKYMGKIVSIGRKTITIEDTNERRRLNWLDFVRLNWDFNEARIISENNAERVCI